MISGPYSICLIDFQDHSDAATYRTLKHGYDAAADAFRNIESVARESNVDASACVVIRFIDAEDADRFAD